MTKPKPKAETKTTTASKKPAANKNAAKFARETLTGDLRDGILQFVRDLQKPWAQMSEMEQRGTIAAVEKRAEGIVGDIVRIIAADGRKTMAGKLENVTVKDGFKATVTLSQTDPLRHELVDSQGQGVLIVVSDKAQYTGEKSPAKFDKNQPQLPLDDKPVADSAKNVPQNKDAKANAGLKGLDKLKAAAPAKPAADKK